MENLKKRHKWEKLHMMDQKMQSKSSDETANGQSHVALHALPTALEQDTSVINTAKQPKTKSVLVRREVTRDEYLKMQKERGSTGKSSTGGGRRVYVAKRVNNIDDLDEQQKHRLRNQRDMLVMSPDEAIQRIEQARAILSPDSAGTSSFVVDGCFTRIWSSF